MEAKDETITTGQARRLALAKAGLLKPELTGLPGRAAGRGRRARERCHAVIERFGYLQIDSIPIAGARTHGIVLASRLAAFDASLAESLLEPGEPLFEYWGHEACWMPMSLYPCFGFRRRAYRAGHPWWGDLLAEHAGIARQIVRRIEHGGALRPAELEGSGAGGMWETKLSSRVAEALWSAGDLAVRERRNFQRSYDLTERVIPLEARAARMSDEQSLDVLLLKALDGHGWASTGTLAATWRLVNCREAIRQSLERLREARDIVPCTLADGKGKRPLPGWARPADLERVDELGRLRPRRDRGVLLSPFDPVLWDRARTRALFDFEQVLEIYKPRESRRYGYYCLPVLAGDRLLGRVDLKADRRAGHLHLLSTHYERLRKSGRPWPQDAAALASALARFARSVGLSL